MAGTLKSQMSMISSVQTLNKPRTKARNRNLLNICDVNLILNKYNGVLCSPKTVDIKNYNSRRFKCDSDNLQNVSSWVKSLIYL